MYNTTDTAGARKRSAGGVRIASGLGAMGFLLLCGAGSARAAGLERVEFQAVDPLTRVPVPGSFIEVVDPTGRRSPFRLRANRYGATPVFNTTAWLGEAGVPHGGATRIALPLGCTVTVIGAPPAGGPPVREITIRVTARRIARRPLQPEVGSAAQLSSAQIKTFSNPVGGGGTSAIIRNESGVASDSSGQQHVRGEHTGITYVVDGVPLPDTLSGRQGSVIVPSTIETLDILTGGFAPEFGGQTAAILNISTKLDVRKAKADLEVQAGNYSTFNSDASAVGPLGKRASYVFDFNTTRSSLFSESPQPDNQTAHNRGASQGFFGRFSLRPDRADGLALTLSRNQDAFQLANRAGLPDRFAPAGQGFGFLGLRNRDGSRPDVTDANSGTLGADPIQLSSQQAIGADSFEREVSEFATLTWNRQIAKEVDSLLFVTLLHSGQDVLNRDRPLSAQALPIDSSLEFSPTVSRNAHHVQLGGSLSLRAGKHRIKVGLVDDEQGGDESYQIAPGSQLALDALADAEPRLAPEGAVLKDAQGAVVRDVNGHPVYVAASGSAPTVRVHRAGFYRAIYAQDTLRAGRTTLNYGLRGDWFHQSQNIGQNSVDSAVISPRINLSYAPQRRTTLRASYNKLFNTPPLAQGALVGAAIQPEILDQYDLSVERIVGPGQSLKLAYYIKDIRNQVDVGLLVPGSQIGLYSAVNFQVGGVHGIEASYDVYPTRGSGLDAFINYTYSIARPNGTDNTGAKAPLFNDHDQRNTVGLGVAYKFKNGASIAGVLSYGSGLASSIVAPSVLRTPRTQVDLRLGTGERFLRGHGTLGLQIENLFDARTVINYQSAFSGTRFQPARKILITLSGTF